MQSSRIPFAMHPQIDPQMCPFSPPSSSFQDWSPSQRKQQANALRILAMDAVEKARSGHPGAPMGMADVLTALWSGWLRHAPWDPEWINRDRFVLSAGHAYMALYGLLHLTGYASMTMGDLTHLRQLGSCAHGHPERAPGIESTTGPLGQGFANAVGMALAESITHSHCPLIDHRTYVMVGDGCLMEGISYEAAALAGHWKLRKLVALWDDNRITIDGPTTLSTSEDTLARFQACGWDVLAVDGHDFDAIANAFSRIPNQDKPLFLAFRTVIGRGAPHRQGTCQAHGSPLGNDEVAAVRAALDWPLADPFVIPDDIRARWQRAGQQHRTAYAAWQQAFAAHPARAAYEAAQSGIYDPGPVQALMDQYERDRPCQATRKSSGQMLQALAQGGAPLVIGSADLGESTQVMAQALSACPWSWQQSSSQEGSGQDLACSAHPSLPSSVMPPSALPQIETLSGASCSDSLHADTSVFFPPHAPMTDQGAGAATTGPVPPERGQNATQDHSACNAQVQPGSADSAKDLVRHGPCVYTPQTPWARYIHYGVREHAMAGVMNGLALHGPWIPCAGTFLAFSDYMRPAIRLAALMHLPAIFVMTHDSIGLGEDGPTHQPVEHLASLRAIPHLAVMRPCDGLETAVCWQMALANRTRPTVLCLTRQNVPTLCHKHHADAIARGAYVLQDQDAPLLDVWATGSEVALACQVADALNAQGRPARVISAPCLEVFADQDPAYRRQLLEQGAPHKVSIEAGSTMGWHRWIGTSGLCIGLDTFGASAPAPDLFQHFGFTPAQILAHIHAHFGWADDR